VLKVEMPGGGDALRRPAPHKDGVPLWWKVTNRNKKGITLDLRKPDGKEPALRQATTRSGARLFRALIFPPDAGRFFWRFQN